MVVTVTNTDSDSESDLSDFADSDDDEPVVSRKANGTRATVVSDSESESDSDADDSDDDADSDEDDHPMPVTKPIVKRSTSMNSQASADTFAADDDVEEYRNEILRKMGSNSEVVVDTKAARDKQLAEDERRARMGEKAYKLAQKKVDDFRMDNKLRKLEAERKNIERENRVRQKKDEEQAAQDKKEREIRNKNLDKHSTHLVSNTRQLLAQRSSELLDMQKYADQLEQESKELDAASSHIRNDFEETVKKTKEKRKVERQKSSDLLAAVANGTTSSDILRHSIRSTCSSHSDSSDMRAKSDARRDRMERIRERKEREKDDREMKEREAEYEKKLQEREEYRSERARLERTYGWYTKLAFPKRDEMKEKIAMMAGVDVSVDDVDLMPWNASGKIVNIPKLNTMLFAKK